MRKTENGKMSSTLTKEYSKYCAEVRQLRQILKDTQKCFKDINQAGIYEGSKCHSSLFWRFYVLDLCCGGFEGWCVKPVKLFHVLIIHEQR
jgi:hypothetical protein